MKQAVFGFLLLFTLSARSQDLTGTWEGQLSFDTWARKEKFVARLELVQLDRDVRGWLSLKADKNDKTPLVIYLLSGELPKKTGATFHLYREGIEEAGFAREKAEYFNDLQVEFKAGDTTLKALNGYWFPNVSNGTLPNGAAGRYALTRTGGGVTADELKLWMKAKEIDARENGHH